MTRRIIAAVGVASVAFLGHARPRAVESPDSVGLCPADSVAVAALDIPAWRPSARHGVHEFQQSVVLEVPRGISPLTVELWGAGGGGGGGATGPGSPTGPWAGAGAGGGGGASGSYARAVIGAAPAKAYILVVGGAGAGGTSEGRAAAAAGQDGGDSYVCEGSSLLAWARGGSGGGPARGKSKGGAGGQARLPELAPRLIATTLLRSGEDGRPGSTALFDLPGSGGQGGEPVVGSVKPTGGWGGNGATGSWAESPANGKPGGGGSIILTW